MGHDAVQLVPATFLWKLDLQVAHVPLLAHESQFATHAKQILKLMLNSQ